MYVAVGLLVVDGDIAAVTVGDAVASASVTSASVFVSIVVQGLTIILRVSVHASFTCLRKLTVVVALYPQVQTNSPLVRVKTFCWFFCWTTADAAAVVVAVPASLMLTLLLLLLLLMLVAVVVVAVGTVILTVA